MLIIVTGCGTLEFGLGEPGSDASLSESVSAQETPSPAPQVVETGSNTNPVVRLDAVAWYGQVHSVDRADPGYDYLKLWHLNLWPKFGRAVGLTGADPAINAEIERIRDRDIRAHFWGTLTCDVADYGACQLRVTRLSANDGGPFFTPDRVEGWSGAVGRLPGQPGSQSESLYFALSGEVPVLYGITSQEPTIQSALERLVESEDIVRIWGELRSRVHPVTGSLITVDRLELVPATPSP